MKRLSNIPTAFVVGIAGMLCAGFASAQTPQFIQVSPLYFTMPVGSNPLSQTLTIVSTGTAFNFNAPTAETASGGAWLKVTGSGCINGNSFYNQTPAVCSVGVNASTLSAGVYTGQVSFSNGSTAMTVPVTLTVGGAGMPFFGGVAGGLNFVSGSGFTPAPQNVQLNNAGTGVLNWTAAVSTYRTSTVGNVNWLSASATSGIAPSIVTVNVSPQGLPAGIYLGQVLFQAAGSSVTIPVSLVVVDSNYITFQQVPAVNFTTPVGSSPLAQTLTIVSTGTAFDFNAPTAETASGGAWLKVTGSGCINGNSFYNQTPAVCSVGVNASTLSAGVYTGQVNFSNGSTTMTVPVTLTVGGAGMPFFGGVAGGLNFVSGSGFTPAPQNVQLNNAGTGVLNWTAAVSTYRTNAAGNVNWLSASATSGIAPSIVTVNVSPQGLPTGIYLGQVLFQAAGSSVTIPVSLVVVGSNYITFQQVPAVNFTTPVGSSPLAQTLTIVSTGTAFDFNAPTAETASGGAWLKITGSGCINGNSFYNQTPAVCSVGVNASTLSAGVYTGQVNFSNGSTAMTVPVTLTVGGGGVPFFGGVAGGLNFVSGSGFTPAPQNVQLNNAGTGVLNWTAAISTYRTSTVVIAGQFSDVNWLSASATSGIAPSIVTVNVSPQGLPAGIYLGQVLFQAASSSVTIPVSLVVVGSNISTFQQMPAVNFTMPVGSNPMSQTLTIVSTGTAFNFNAPTAETASGGAWLKVTGSGCINGNSFYNQTPAVCSVGVNASTLSAGVYTGQVNFSNGSTAMTVPVTLTVGGAGVPFFGGVGGGLNFVSGSGFTPAPQNVQLNNAGTGVLNWTAAVSTYRTSTVVIAGQFSDVNWLSASATSGIAPSIVTVNVSPQGLPAGIYLGQVLFQAAGSSVTIPVSLVVVDSNYITFQQVPAVNFTTPVGSSPLAQTLTIVSTGTAFSFNAPTAETASGGNWLKITGSGCINGNSFYNQTPAACSVGVNASTLSAGIYAGQVVFSNGSTAMTVPVTLTVSVVAPTITLGPASLPAAVVNLAYSAQLTASGGTSPYTYSLVSGNLPAGLTLSFSGLISGTPTQQTSAAFVVQAKDAVGATGQLAYTLSVVAPTITLGPASLTAAIVNVPYSAQLTASGGTLPYSFSVFSGNLPVGLSLAPSGAISGTPTQLGSATFTVQAKDANSAIGQLAYTISVGPAARPVITGIVNDASFTAGGAISSGSWVAIFGTGLAPAGESRKWVEATEIVNGKLPVSLDGTSVSVNGKPAAVEFIQPSQVNIQPPDDTAVGPVQVVVNTAAGASDPFTVNYSKFAPGLFPASAPYIVAQHADNSYVTTATPAKPGEVIILWGTGFGPANPAVPAGQVFSGANPLANAVTVMIGGQAAAVDFAGVVGAGLVQINVHVPFSINNGDAAVVATVGGVSTQATGNMISIHN